MGLLAAAVSAPTTLIPTIPSTTGTTVPTSTTSAATFPVILLSVCFLSLALALVLVASLPEEGDDAAGRIRLIAFGACSWVTLLLFGAALQQISLNVTGGSPFSSEENYSWWANALVPWHYHVGLDGLTIPPVMVVGLLSIAVIGVSWQLRGRVKAFVCGSLLLSMGALALIVSVDVAVTMVGLALCLPGLCLILWATPGTLPRRAWAGLFVRYGIASVTIPAGLVLNAVASGTTALGPNASHAPVAIIDLAFWLTTIGWLSLTCFPLAHLWSRPLASVWTGTRLWVFVILPVAALCAWMRMDLGLLAVAAHHFRLVIAVLGCFAVVFSGIGQFLTRSTKDASLYMSMFLTGIVIFSCGAQTPIGLEGSIYVLAGGAAVIGLLTLVAGAVDLRAQRTGEPAGLTSKMGTLTGLGAVGLLGSTGVPFLSLFIGMFFIIVGSFPVHRWMSVAVLAGWALHQAGLVRIGHRLFDNGRSSEAGIPDAAGAEVAASVPMVIGAVIFGLLPGLFAPMIGTGMATIVARLGGG